jgi:ADP-heptose:LPS heptosyltransferase
MTPEPIILRSPLPPGDIMTMTAAVKSLHDNFPEKYIVDVRTQHPDIWENNPLIQKLDKGKIIDLNYPIVNTAGNVSVMFIQAYMENLSEQLGIQLKLTTNRPDIYFTEEEIEQPPFPDIPKQYILFNAGVKRDYTAKQWPLEYFKIIIDHFKDIIPFVQVGRTKDIHFPIDGAINMIGKTSLRQLLRLCLHSVGGLCSVTFLQHAMAAAQKPCIVLLGGRENIPWVSSYPYQTTLHRIGSSLPCCHTSACWKSRIVPLYDGKTLPNSIVPLDKSLCELPVTDTMMPVAKCMYDIKPEEVISHIKSYL